MKTKEQIINRLRELEILREQNLINKLSSESVIIEISNLRKEYLQNHSIKF